MRERVLRFWCYVLLYSFGLQALPPMALAQPAPTPPPPVSEPAPLAPSEGPAEDREVERALRAAGQNPDRYGLPAPGPRIPASLEKLREVNPELVPGAQPSSVEGGQPAAEPAPSVPAPVRVAQEPSPEPSAEPEPSPTASPLPRPLSVVDFPNDDRVPPPAGWTRKTHPNSQYFPMSAITPEQPQAFTNDYRLYYGHRLEALPNPGTKTVEWDFISPVAEHNKVAGRNSFVSMKLEYTSVGAQAADFDSSYTIKLTVWDKSRPGGKVVRTISQPTHLDNFYLYAGFVPIDAGNWTLRETHDGQEASTTFIVHAPPEPPAGALSRRLRDSYRPLVGAAYTTDEWVMMNKTYPLSCQDVDPEPEDPPTCTRRAQIFWHWKGPEAENKTSLGTYRSVKLKYRTDAAGSTHRLTMHVYDRNYPGGRLVTGVNGTGTLANATIIDGSGLLTYGPWTFEESINNVTSPPQEFEVRHFTAHIEHTPGVYFPDNGGGFDYPVKLETFPITWVPSNVDFKIELRDARENSTVRTLTDTVTANTENPLQRTLHWDGQKQAGGQVDLGSPILPQLSVELPDVTSARTRRVAQAGPALDSGDSLAQISSTPGPALRLPPSGNPLRVSTSRGAAQNWQTVPGARAGQVDAGTGQQRYVHIDLSLPTRGLPIILGRYYLSERADERPYFGWRFTFQDELSFTPGQFPEAVTHVFPDGRTERFVRHVGSGTYVAARSDMADKLQQLDVTTFTITDKNRVTTTYKRLTSETDKGVMVEEKDRNGNKNTYTWTSLTVTSPLQSISDPVGRRLSLTHSGNQLHFATDWANPPRRVTYTYSKVPGFQELLMTLITLPDGEKLDYDYLAQKLPGTGQTNNSLFSVTIPGQYGLQQKFTAKDWGAYAQWRNSQGQLTTWQRKRKTQVPQLIDAGSKALAQEAGGPVPDVGSQIAGAVSLPDAHYESLISIRGVDGQVRSWKMEFDPLYRPLDTIDPLLGKTTYRYREDDTLDFKRDQLGHTTRWGWDENFNPNLITNDANEVTNITWTPTNEVDEVSKMVGGDRLTTKMEYDPQGNLKKVTDPAGHFMTYTYNAFGQVETMINEQGKIWSYGYDANGYMNKSTTPRDSGAGNETILYEPDAVGRNLAITDAKQNRTTYTYDMRDRVTNITIPPADTGKPPRTIHYEWNKQDLLEKMNDGAGHVYEFKYDKALRLHQLIELSNGGKTTTYEYDEKTSQLKSVRHPGQQQITYSYDDLGRVKTILYPGNGKEEYDWDAVGNLDKWRKVDGTQVDYDYDNLNRLTRITHGQTQTNTVFTYDELNRPKTMADAAGSSSWTYTRNGLLDTHTRDGKTIDYDYDALDRLASVKDPEGVTTTYTYTGRDLLETATQDSKTFTYTHDPNGNVSAIVYPNGVNCDVTYDHRNQITQLAYKRGTTQLLTLSYTYDQSGLQKTAKRDTPDRDDNRSYDYDKRLQVTNTTRVIQAGGTTTRLGRGYTYDDNYNRQSMRVNNTTTVNYSTDPTDRLNITGNTTFGYNTNGNVDRITEGGSQVTLTYNHADQVTQLTGAGGTATYVYDGNGQRIKRTPPGGSEIRYLWAGDEVLKEYHSDGAVQYLLGAGREGIKKDGSWKFYLTDAQGSVVALTDEQGTVTDTWEYGDFGETTRLTGNSYNPYLYTGQQFDPEFGGHYFLRARLYYPQYGRFLSRDPIGWEGGSNVFAYCDNNPLNFSDPSGLRGWGEATDDFATRGWSEKEKQKYAQISGGIPSLAVGGLLVRGGQAALMWARMNPLKAVIAGDATVGAVTGMPTGNMLPTSLGSATYRTTQTASGSHQLTTTIQSAQGAIQMTATIAMEEGKVIISNMVSMSGGRGALGTGAVKGWLKGMQETALRLFPDAMEGEIRYTRDVIFSTSKNPGVPRVLPFTRR